VVLIKQNRLARIEKQRAHLDLQLNLLTEQKTTKLIDPEELRNDLSMVKNRHDPASAALQKPTDPHMVLAALDEQHETKRDQQVSDRPRRTAKEMNDSDLLDNDVRSAQSSAHSRACRICLTQNAESYFLEERNCELLELGNSRHALPAFRFPVFESKNQHCVPEILKWSRQNLRKLHSAAY
jgi:hypothetical protein